MIDVCGYLCCCIWEYLGSVSKLKIIQEIGKNEHIKFKCIISLHESISVQHLLVLILCFEIYRMHSFIFDLNMSNYHCHFKIVFWNHIIYDGYIIKIQVYTLLFNKYNDAFTNQSVSLNMYMWPLHVFNLIIIV